MTGSYERLGRPQQYPAQQQLDEATAHASAAPGPSDPTAHAQPTSQMCPPQQYQPPQYPPQQYSMQAQPAGLHGVHEQTPTAVPVQYTMDLSLSRRAMGFSAMAAYVPVAQPATCLTILASMELAQTPEDLRELVLLFDEFAETNWSQVSANFLLYLGACRRRSPEGPAPI